MDPNVRKSKIYYDFRKWWPNFEFFAKNFYNQLKDHEKD